MIPIDLLGFFIYFIAIYTVFVKNKRNFKKVHIYQICILSDFFLSFSMELLFFATTSFSLSSSLEICPSYLLRMALKININFDIVLLQIDRFFAFYRPLLHNDSTKNAMLQVILVKILACLLSLFSIYLSPSFIFCSSCLFCVSTRPVFVYMTSYLCIITLSQQSSLPL